MVFVLFDSLVKKAMGCYGGSHIKTPNFDDFSKRAVTFENHYVGSLPCMPARRDLHTGRLNFLHRSWGPLEPFDDSFSEILRKFKVLVELLSLDDKITELALSDDTFPDFEDGLQYYSAIENDIDIIITRNKKDFKNSKLPVLTAKEFLAGK